MENLGSLAILLAFCAALYATVASVIGGARHKPFLVVSGRRAVYSVWVLVTLASGILVYSLMTGDFRFAYVAEHSNRSMPMLYKFAAWWGGQEGSLLFWSWLLSGYAMVVAFTNRRKHRDMMPYVVAVLTTVEAFFLLLNNFIANPFQMLATDKLIVAVPDGNGLSPLLQYPAMAIHPPMLYLGYVGFAVPFAFAIGSLITRQPGDGWIHTTRRWTLVTWLFQSAGVMLGAAWAYHVLGWGGYWGWDPVENASLLPWLSGTAFLHSVMMQEKKGMMKVWNMVLISATFFLCILGTFMTRSGFVESVHAFARSDIGKYFVTFLAVGIAATIYLILDRLDYLKSEAQLESVVSRESSFLFNNLILLAELLRGAMGHAVSDDFRSPLGKSNCARRRVVQPPDGPHRAVPAVPHRCGTAVCVAQNVARQPAAEFPVAGDCVAGAGGRADSGGHVAILPVDLIWLLPVRGADGEARFYKGARSIAAKNHMNLLRATVELTHGIPGLRRVPGPHGDRADIHRAHRPRFQPERSEGTEHRRHHARGRLRGPEDGGLEAGREPELPVASRYHAGFQATALRSGTLEPEKRFYLASKQGTSEVGVRSRLNEDLYLNFGGMSDDNQRAVIQAGARLAWFRGIKSAAWC